jgi:hypothetical protein
MASAKRRIVTPEADLALHREWLGQSLAVIEQGKALLTHPNPEEVKRGRYILTLNYGSIVKDAYCIGQVNWRLALADPTDALVDVVRYFARAQVEWRAHGAEVDNYWAHLVAFVAVILSGSVPAWVAHCQADLSSYSARKGRLKPWEINLGYQTALAVALHSGKLPDCWPRFVADAEGRSGLIRIQQNVRTYERLFLAAQARSWNDLIVAVHEVDANYRKRASSSGSSHTDVYGDGPSNDRSIDFIAAAILRTVQREESYPANRIDTPHQWRWGERDLTPLEPSILLA